PPGSDGTAAAATGRPHETAPAPRLGGAGSARPRPPGRPRRPVVRLQPGDERRAQAPAPPHRRRGGPRRARPARAPGDPPTAPPAGPGRRGPPTRRGAAPAGRPPALNPSPRRWCLADSRATTSWSPGRTATATRRRPRPGPGAHRATASPPRRGLPATRKPASRPGRGRDGARATPGPRPASPPPSTLHARPRLPAAMLAHAGHPIVAVPAPARASGPARPIAGTPHEPPPPPGPARPPSPGHLTPAALVRPAPASPAPALVHATTCGGRPRTIKITILPLGGAAHHTPG